MMTRDDRMVYVVWGGWEGQDEGEHFADFETLEEAEAYKLAETTLDPFLTLHISARNRYQDTPRYE